MEFGRGSKIREANDIKAQPGPMNGDLFEEGARTLRKRQHILESQQFTKQWLEDELFPLARLMEKIKHRGSASLAGKDMITFFYEPSTRTRISFEIAMWRLGGRVVSSTENAGITSSAIKGENLVDSIKMLNEYEPDVIVLRHYEEGSAKVAAACSNAPIINAGDGKGQHPTQSLLDIFTIREELGGVDGIKVALVGDLARGRTVRSLAYLLGKFDNITISFVSQPTLKIGDDIKAYLLRHRITFSETSDLREVADKVDVIYQTRKQIERGVEPEKDSTNSFCRVDETVLALLKRHAIIMHPLPKVDEIAPSVDSDPRAAYFRQAGRGLSVRMALLEMILR